MQDAEVVVPCVGQRAEEGQLEVVRGKRCPRLVEDVELARVRSLRPSVGHVERGAQPVGGDVCRDGGRKPVAAVDRRRSDETGRAMGQLVVAGEVVCGVRQAVALGRVRDDSDRPVPGCLGGHAQEVTCLEHVVALSQLDDTPAVGPPRRRDVGGVGRPRRTGQLPAVRVDDPDETGQAGRCGLTGSLADVALLLLAVTEKDEGPPAVAERRHRGPGALGQDHAQRSRWPDVDARQGDGLVALEERPECRVRGEVAGVEPAQQAEDRVPRRAQVTTQQQPVT